MKDNSNYSKARAARWAKVPAEERSAIGLKMVQARWQGKSETERKAVGEMIRAAKAEKKKNSTA